jgi:GDPmannose 4,6-dehydratase
VTRTALIVGSGGQDGRILSGQLLAQGFRVVGVDKPNTPVALGVQIAPVSLDDRNGLLQLVQNTQPDEVYYLAAFHHAASERSHVDTTHLLRESLRVNVDGLVIVLEALRTHCKDSRLFYASSSHVFGVPTTSPQNESTPHRPQSAYAISKCTAMNICRLLRDQEGCFAISGILYNHESALRGAAFVSTKIATAAATAARVLARGEPPEALELGSLDSVVDWSAAEDICRAMQAALRTSTPRDYVIGSGVAHKVRDFCSIAYGEVGLDWEKYVVQRPGAVIAPGPPLVADTELLRSQTGWAPTLSFESLVCQLVREKMS